MHLRPVLVTAPPVLVVSLDEAKASLRVDGTEEDQLIEQLIKAAITHFDGYTGILGRCLVNQTWLAPYDKWPGNGDIRLPFPDVSAVSLVYSDDDDEEQTLASSSYELLEDARGSLIRFRSAFARPSLYDDRTDAIRVSLTAGYGAAAGDVPEAIRLAIRMLVGHWFNKREAVGEAMSEVPLSVAALSDPYRHGRI